MLCFESSAACRRPEELCVTFTHNSAFPPTKFSYNSNYAAMRSWMSLSRCSRGGQNIVVATKIIQLCPRTGPMNTFQKLAFVKYCPPVPEGTSQYNRRGEEVEKLSCYSRATTPVLLQTQTWGRNSCSQIFSSKFTPCH